MANLKKKKEIRQEPKTQCVSIYFSGEELKMLDYYIQKFKHKNRSSYIRKLVMTDVLSQLFESYPTLFEQDIKPKMIDEKTSMHNE